MSTTLSKLWKGTKDGVKWILIQAGVLLAIGLLYYLGLLCYSLLTGMEFREALISYPIGGSGAYNWRTGLCIAIPIYSLLFGWWHAFFTKKSQRWTFVFPWLLLMVLFYLHVAHERDWAFQIITVDEYMLAGWMAPVLGILSHSILKRTKAGLDLDGIV